MKKSKFGSEASNWRGGQVQKNCLICDKSFNVDPNVIRKGYGNFCSRSCVGKRSYGRRTSEKINFRCKICKSKFRRYKSDIIREPNRGKCCSNSCRVKYTQKRISGNKHYKWKGKKVGYDAAHQRLKRLLGSPWKCSQCGTTKAKKLEWASIGKRYWSIKNYVGLCCSCHRKKDKTYLNYKRGKNAKSKT